MKRLLLILLFASLAGNFNNSVAQLNDAINYMPLEVGNVWVYYMSGIAPGGGMTGMDRYEITGIIQANGKFYFSWLLTRRILSGSMSYGCASRLFVNSESVRVDSVTGNFYRNSYCNGSETLVDSLNSKLNDLSVVCGNFQGNNATCNDTSIYNIFGGNRPSKRFYVSGFEGYNSERYAKGIGMVLHQYGQLMHTCSITLRGCLIDGILYGDTSMLVGINQINTEVPEQFSLLQNYPNPFNPVTNIKFQIPKFGIVKLTVYDLLGKELHILVNEELSPGTYEAYFDGSNLPSGVYYYKLETDEFAETKKMVLVK